jgi:DNA-directed RNA polymerase subunit RPC12/RpoP
LATLLQVVCDICPDHEKVPGTPEVLGIDGRLYEADLCAADRAELRNRLAPFLSLLRPIPKAPAKSHKKQTRPAAKEDDQRRVKGGDLPALACRKCGATYYGFQGRGAHERLCDGTIPEPSEFHCAECRRNFANEMQFILHQFEIHKLKTEGVFQCPECGRPYRHEDKMIAHLNDRHSLQGATA